MIINQTKKFECLPQSNEKREKAVDRMMKYDVHEIARYWQIYMYMRSCDCCQNGPRSSVSMAMKG